MTSHIDGLATHTGSQADGTPFAHASRSGARYYKSGTSLQQCPAAADVVPPRGNSSVQGGFDLNPTQLSMTSVDGRPYWGRRTQYALPIGGDLLALHTRWKALRKL